MGLDMLTNQWIWQQEEWPNFTWREDVIQPLLQSTRLKQGVLLGRASAVPSLEHSTTQLDTLLQNIITSSAIEGEALNAQSVRSSLAKRLGLEGGLSYPTSDRSEGLAEMMIDAITYLDQPLTIDRLFQWHRWLFVEQDIWSGRIRVGGLRGDEPMQVVSGRIDRPTVHFQAPDRHLLVFELERFIAWFNLSRLDSRTDPLVRAAITHFWFVTLHPFDDGNGRITRALTDLALAQAEHQSIRLYAMSAAILDRRKDYYQILEKSQRSGLDITEWLSWFLQTLELTLHMALDHIDKTLNKTLFWQQFRNTTLSSEQIKVLNRLLDGGNNGFEHGISASQYQKVAKVSKATATRHLTDLLEKGCIEKLPGGGRNTRYQVITKRVIDPST